MPETSSLVKQAAVAVYGGQVILCEPTFESRESTLEAVIKKTGATKVHPYNDSRVIAGQGTAALELLEDVDQLHVVIAPVSGGGLLSGTAVAARGLSPTIEIIGAEPKEDDDAYRSLMTGKILPATDPKTVADGLAGVSLGDLTFPIIRELVGCIITVTEEEIIAAMRLIWERLKIVVEPSAAVPLAALFAEEFDPTGKRVGVILSGGNVDLDRLPWMI